MKPSLYLVASSLPGELFIMPKPSGEWLEEDMAHYRAVGIETIVSMLEPDEANELMLHDEHSACSRNQMEFLQLPVRDRGLPAIEQFEGLVRSIVERLKKGRCVAVHCRAGIGRAGMTACCVLLDFGYTAQEAIEHTSDARGVPVPDTTEQREFIEHFELARDKRA